MPALKNSPRKSKGFTLLELLIALFIFTIVSIIMMGALHNIINIQTAAEKKSDRFTELQIALLIFSRDVEQTINRTINDGAANVAALKGNAHTLEFTHGGLSNPLGLLSRSTLQRTRYEIKNHNLMRISWQVLDRTSESKADERILLHDVENAQFDYVDHEGHLKTEWPVDSQQPFTPRAVRITLTLKNWGKLSQLYLIPGQPLEKKPR